MHGPTDKERTLMEQWAGILVAFVNDDQSYDFGTKEVHEVKIASPEGNMEIAKDERWEDLLKLNHIFASG
jgi:hypothetical protein